VKGQRQDIQQEQFDTYSEDDDTITDGGSRAFSSVADHHRQHQDSPSPPCFMLNEPSTNNEASNFENMMKDPENGRVSRYQNTYFMDGGNRFISVSKA
jgi:hypothetical protein